LAEIKPFRGIRYNQAAIGDLSKVVCPPYDVISPQDRAYYHALHPKNFVRMVLGEERETDDELENRFTRARHYLEDWLAKGILKQDPVPAIYVYQQEFNLGDDRRTIRGFICAVRLHEYAESVILPHEDTLSKPKSELIQLIRAVRANLDSVYGLYGDEQGKVDAILEQVSQTPPEACATDKDGVLHKLWLLTDPKAISTIADQLEPCRIAIADGHHRYETALAYRQECKSKTTETNEHPCDYTLMTLVNVHQKDLTVFPTHRVVKNIPDEIVKKLDIDLPDYFDIEPSSADSLVQDMRSRRAIGMFTCETVVTLRPKPESRALIPGSPASQALELNVLHKLILERVLGINQEKLRNQDHIYYTRDADEAMELVRKGHGQVAFLLNNIDVRSVLEIATAGERMPQKATYFYPKLISGLVARILY
jgi:uncharacterized protein (DUF1015 family)